MSIFSKMKFIFILLLLLNITSVFAEDVSYSPEFVDTFLIQNSQNSQVSEIVDNVSDSKLNEKSVWDVQHLREKRTTPSLILILPVIVLLMIIMKYIFRGFFNTSMSSIANGKVFQLHYRNKKYSEPIPLFILFLLRNIALVMLCQYIVYVYLNDGVYLGLKYFGIGFVLITTFFSLLYLIEFIVQTAIGVGGIFRMYFTQYYLITTWSWMPLIAIILVIHLNGIHIGFNVIALLLAVPVLLFSILAIIRSIILLNTAWRDNLIYFFMYLCTFKIIPYLILLKIIKDFAA